MFIDLSWNYDYASIIQTVLFKFLLILGGTCDIIFWNWFTAGQATG